MGAHYESIFRWFPIGPDRFVVTSDHAGTTRLAGYAGKDAAERARAKAEALATWSRSLGYAAEVQNYPLRAIPVQRDGHGNITGYVDAYGHTLTPPVQRHDV